MPPYAMVIATGAAIAQKQPIGSRYRRGAFAGERIRGPFEGERDRDGRELRRQQQRQRPDHPQFQIAAI